MKGKSTFTQSEADAIINLIRQKLISNTQDQKKVRDKIRAKGFYASDFGIGGGYNENDFLRVVTIIGAKTTETAATTNTPISKPDSPKIISTRESSDESYVLDLCDRILNLESIRQHRFDFLVGDSGTRLPVDAWYPSLLLVIEYRERQHTEEVKLFDRRSTVSGVSRGEQRKIYDQRRRDILPKHGIQLIEIGFDDFKHNSSKRLLRNEDMDLSFLRSILSQKLQINFIK